MDCTVRTGCKASIKAGVVKNPLMGRYAGNKQDKMVDDAKCGDTLLVGDAWLVGVGKRAPHGLRCICFVSPHHGSLDRLKACL